MDNKQNKKKRLFQNDLSGEQNQRNFPIPVPIKKPRILKKVEGKQSVSNQPQPFVEEIKYHNTNLLEPTTTNQDNEKSLRAKKGVSSLSNQTEQVCPQLENKLQMHGIKLTAEEKQIYSPLEGKLQQNSNINTKYDFEGRGPSTSKQLDRECMNNLSGCKKTNQLSDQNGDQNNFSKSKETPSRKDKYSIKYDTEHGNEYQRMVQILLRHRGFRIPEFKIGTEVKKVGDFDDIVCCVGNSWRFFQVKHEQDIESQTPQVPMVNSKTSSQSKTTEQVELQQDMNTPARQDKNSPSECKIAQTLKCLDLEEIEEDINILQKENTSKAIESQQHLENSHNVKYSENINTPPNNNCSQDIETPQQSSSHHNEKILEDETPSKQTINSQQNIKISQGLKTPQHLISKNNVSFPITAQINEAQQGIKILQHIKSPYIVEIPEDGDTQVASITPKKITGLQNFENPQQIMCTHDIKTPDKTSNVVVLHKLFDINHYEKTAEYEIVRYFKSFCKIKLKHEMFKNAEITEMTIVTNRPLRQEIRRKKYKKTIDKDTKFIEFLVLRDDFENDSFLYLGKESGTKYSLNIEALEKYTAFMSCLQSIYDDFKEKQGVQTKSEDGKELINEFLKKFHIVVNYPNSNMLKDLVFKEIVMEHDFSMEVVNLVGSHIIHKEIDRLMKRGKHDNEFLTNEDWKKVIEESKQSFESLESSVIATYQSHDLLNRHDSIIFEYDKIKDMYEDILLFLTHDDKCILHVNKAQNEKLVAIKTLSIISQIKENRKQILSRDFNVAFTGLYSLIRGNVQTTTVNHFISGTINTLIITVRSNDNDDNKVEELADKLVKGLNRKNQKLVIISTSNHCFTNKIKDLSENCYLEKHYKHDFSCLNKKSREEILSKPVLLHDKIIPFGSLFNYDLSFANNVIDENVLLTMSDREESQICLLDKSSFTSPGYNDRYYISRKLIQKRVDFDVVKEKMQDELFFITPTNGLGSPKLIKLLVENGISESHIQDFQKKPSRGRRKIEKNGIILNGSANGKNENLFKKLAERNIIAHWLLVWNSSLIHVDSIFKSREDEALQISPRFTDEISLLQSQTREKIVILAGDSGVGKSTVLTHIANNVLKLSDDIPVWIVKVNLRTFFRRKKLNQIEKLTETIPTIDLLCEMGSLSDPSEIVAKKIIKEGLKKSHEDNFHLVLLLDGFNEISPKFQEHTCNFVKTLSSECNIRQIWITTQIQGKIKLEDMLHVPAYILDSLDEERQISLMVKYWTTKYKSEDPPVTYDIEELKVDAQRALQTWKKSINETDEQSFTQVSLNLIILSDILLSNSRKIDWNIDLTSLYETFICKKFSAYKEEISEPHRHFTEVEQIKEKMFEYSIKEILQELSAHIILTTYNKNSVKLKNSMIALQRFKSFVEDLQKNEIEVTYQSILSKIGFLSVKEEIDFTHESFAQYFFSEYLVHNLHDKTLKTFFVKHVLTERHLYLCRKFLNHSIKKLFGANKERTHQNLKRKTKALPLKDLPKILKTWAITQTAEDKLDHVIILLLHVIGSYYNIFLGLWVKNEVNFCTENEETVKQIVTCLVKEPKDRVPSKLRRILKINKSHFNEETKLKNILDEDWFTEDSQSQDAF